MYVSVSGYKHIIYLFSSQDYSLFLKNTNAPQNHMCKLLPSLVYKDWLAEHLVLSEEDGRD
jgi:hypothetical protein